MDIKQKIKNFIYGDNTDRMFSLYKKRFDRYSFVDCKCTTKKQLEASIIRLYHTIEKGLSYVNYRAGFGKENVKKLIISLQQYAEKYDVGDFCYRTGLSCLNEYVQKNRKYDFCDDELEKIIAELPGEPNNCGGVVRISAYSDDALNAMNYEQLIKSRHSMRHFGQESVDKKRLDDAIQLAQHTPSACNRQGWKTRVISDKAIMAEVLRNQNGNKGFGQEFDQLLLITSDVRCFQRDREIFQAFIDGGMYAENLINALFYRGIAAVPLSASLTSTQEVNARKLLGISDSEVFIMYIGIGCYPVPDECITTKSTRKPSETNWI